MTAARFSRPRFRPRSVRGTLLALATAAAFTLTACANQNQASGQSNNPPGNAAAANNSAPVAPPAGASGLEQAYIEVVRAAQPSVVQINSGRGLGSGIIFDNQGNIVTNAHVVAGATKFQVRLAGGPTSYPATLVGAYPPDDVAVIHLDFPPPALHPARFGDSKAVQPGTIVLAMGNPLGLTGSVTNGIVSATGRTVTEPGQGGAAGATLPDTIQTSASINPGNSGGALVNLSGQVIGMPTLAALDPELGGSAAPGIGFAISSNVFTDIARQMIANNGRVVNTHRAELGIQAVSVIGQGGQPAGAGIAAVVPRGPAEQAGLKPGEIITSINDVPIQSASDLVTALAQLNPGMQVPVTVMDQSGQSHTVTVTLGELPGS